MPHGGVKIGHLARETAKEGEEEKNQKEGKIGACVFLQGLSSAGPR